VARAPVVNGGRVASPGFLFGSFALCFLFRHWPFDTSG
jgi:hypothetical protein